MDELPLNCLECGIKLNRSGLKRRKRLHKFTGLCMDCRNRRRRENAKAKSNN